LPDQYAEKSIRVNPDTVYLNHFITCINQGIFSGLNNNKLREFGRELKFYPGVPEIFRDLKDVVEKEQKYKKGGGTGLQARFRDCFQRIR